MWAGAAASLVGGFMSSSSAKKAAKQQEAAAREGMAAQREMYDIGREDLAPYRGSGSAANDRLAYLLGIGGSGSVNPAVTQAQARFDQAQQQYNSLSSGGYGGPRYAPMTGPDGGFTGPPDQYSEWQKATQGYNREDQQGGDSDGYMTYIPPVMGGGGGSSAEMDQARNALAAAQAQPWSPGGDYGSLMQKFTGQDLYDDPGYQFRLDEGRKGMENSAAARGMQLSGANIKGLSRYSQDYASNEFGAARNRFMGDQDQTYNYLGGMSDRGQNAASQSAGMAQNFGSQQSNALQNIGNARSAGTVSSGNNLASGMNSAYNAYQDANTTQRLNAALRGGGSAGYSGQISGYSPNTYGRGPR
jgi:hypothetical protein